MALEDVVAHITDPEERAEALSKIRHEIARRQRREVEAAKPTLIRSEKHCPRCRTVKPIEDFGIDRSRADGRYGYCRACR